MRFPPFLLVLGIALLLVACRQTPPEPGLSLTATVGTTADACADTTELTLVADGSQTVYYCYTIENTGDVAIPVHDLVDELSGIILREFAYDLAAGASINTVDAGITLARDLEVSTTNTATWDGFRGSERIATAEASTTVTLVPSTLVEQLSLSATVGTAADTCADTTELTLIADGPQTVYYCYTIENTGDFSIPVHDLADDLFGVILREFAYTLDPGESVDTVTAGLTLERTIEATTTNAATWDGFRDNERVATAEASSIVTLVPTGPTAQFGAVAGTFVGNSNSPTIGSFSGNVLVIGVLGFDGEPVDAPVEVEITVPGIGTFAYTFDPAVAMSGVVALILADFEAVPAPSSLRALGVPVTYLAVPSAQGVSPAAAVGGDFVFAFPGQTLVRTVDVTRVLDVPTVSDVTLNPDRDVMTVSFTTDASTDVSYQVDAFGRGPAAVWGYTTGTASPIDVELTGALAVDEPFVVDVLAISGGELDLFESAGQIDVAEYLYYSE